MPTTVTNTIGTGGNYSTIAAWNSAAPSNLVTANEIWEGLLLDQSFTGQTITISGSTTSTTCYKELACNPGASFRDNASVRSNALQFNTANGAAISGGTHYVPCLQVSEANFHLFGVQIAATSAVQNTISASGVTGVIIDSCIVESFSGSTAPPLNIDEGTVKNSLLIVRGSSAGAIAQVQGNSSFYNCTLVVPSNLTAAALGIQVKYPTGTTIVENTAVFGATTCYTSTGTSTITSCATDQASPPTGFTTMTYNTSLFVSVTDASRDYRLPQGSALIGAATADSVNAATDISGLARPQNGSWDIGAWEFQPPVPQTMTFLLGPGSPHRRTKFRTRPWAYYTPPPISGSAAVVESSDVVSGSGTLASAGSAAITESADIVAGTGGGLVSGSAAITELADTVAASGLLLSTSIGLVRSPGPGVNPFTNAQFRARPFAFTPLPVLIGTAAIVEAADVVSGVGTLPGIGSAAIIEPSDIVAGVGGIGTSGSSAITESSDTVAGSGALSTSGTAAINEPADTVSGSGSLSATGSASIVEAPDVVSGSGNAGLPTGSAAITEAPDTVAASGGLSTSGSAALAEAADVVSGAGAIGGAGSATITEAADTASGSGTAAWTGTAAIVETPDVIAGSGAVGGGAAIVEPPDVVVGTGALSEVGSASIVESNDAVAGVGGTGMRFGKSTISVSASVIIEESACFVTVNFIDINGQPLVPNAASYRLDDVASGRQILGWTSLAPLSASMFITVTATQNELLGRPFETHQCLVQLTDGYGNIDNVRVTWDICQVVGLPN